MEARKGIVYNIQRMSTKDGPGLRTTVFLKGCPLHCPWCSNPESQSFKPQLMVFSNLCVSCGACAKVCPNNAVVLTADGKFNRSLEACRNCGACPEVCPAKAREISGKYMTVDEVMKVVDSDSLFYENSGGGVTFGGGEPTAAGEFLLALIDASIRRGYHICLDTCGACSEEMFARVLPKVDMFLFDCKHMDPVRHKELTGLDNSIILKNMATALMSGKDVHIRIPLMPGINDTEENITAMATFLHAHGKYEVDVLPCHTFGLSKYSALRLPAPAMEPYTPDELAGVLARFAQSNLTVEIIK